MNARMTCYIQNWAIQNNIMDCEKIKLGVSRKQSQITVELCSDRFCFLLSIVRIMDVFCVSELRIW